MHPAPSPRAYPLARSSKLYDRPSGENILIKVSRVVLTEADQTSFYLIALIDMSKSELRITLAPPTMACLASPVRSA